MAYSVNLLTNEADCDKLLAAAESELKVLRHRASNQDYARESSGETATEIQASLTSLEAEITALNTVIPTLTTGTKARKNNEVDLRNAVHTRAGLLDRLEARGPVAVLMRERNLAEIDAQIEAITAFVAAVTARKAAL